MENNLFFNELYKKVNEMLPDVIYGKNEMATLLIMDLVFNTNKSFCQTVIEYPLDNIVFCKGALTYFDELIDECKERILELN
jgi:hypothetical protein